MLPAPLQLYESAIQCESSSRVLMLQAAHSLIFTFEQIDEQLKLESFSSTLRTIRLELAQETMSSQLSSIGTACVCRTAICSLPSGS